MKSLKPLNDIQVIAFPCSPYYLLLWSTSLSGWIFLFYLLYFLMVHFVLLVNFYSKVVFSFWGAVSPPSNLMGPVSQSVTVSDFEIYLMEKPSAELTKLFLSKKFWVHGTLFTFSIYRLIFVLAVLSSCPIGRNNHGWGKRFPANRIILKV